MRIIFSLLFLVFAFVSTNAQIGRLALSPKQKVNQNIAKTDITIEYSRPSKRDRVIFGDLVPFNEYWRTGANQNTTIYFSQDVLIESQRIKKGKYAIITKPGKTEWDFILYKEIDNWGVPEKIEEEKIVCEVKTKVNHINQEMESMTIWIGDFDNYQFELNIAWDQTLVTLPIQLSTKEQMAKIISEELSGPKAGDYYSAAIYQMESEKNYEQGLAWINKAISIRKEAKWYDYRAQCILLYELKRKKEMLTSLQEGRKLAEEIENQYGINEFNRLEKLSLELR